MKITNKVILLATAMALTTLFSCRKNHNSESQLTVSGTEGIQLLSALRSTPQTFTVQAGANKKFVGHQGTYLEFYPNSFKDKSGNIITTGTINIELIEMYRLGDMIANRTSTSTANGVLTSGGEVNIKATMGGQEVFANRYRIGFPAASRSTNPMGLYYGNNNNADSITVWEAPKQDTVSGTVVLVDTIIECASIWLFDSCSSFHFINCDRPYNSSSKFVTIKIAFPDNSFDSDYGGLNMAFPSLNVAIGVNLYEHNLTTHTVTYKGYLPTGSQGKIVLIIPRKDASSWYYYEQNGIINGDTTIHVNMTKMSQADVSKKLSLL